MERFTTAEINELLGMVAQDKQQQSDALGQLASMLKAVLGLR